MTASLSASTAGDADALGRGVAVCAGDAARGGADWLTAGVDCGAPHADSTHAHRTDAATAALIPRDNTKNIATSSQRFM